MDTSLFDILKEASLMTEDTMSLVRNYSSRWGCTVFDAILETHSATEEELADALASQLKIDRLYSLAIDVQAVDVSKEIPYQRAWEFKCLPINKVEEGGESLLEIAFSDPSNAELVDRVREIVSKKIKVVVAERSDILKAIQLKYPANEQVPSLGGLSV
jgi:hypothetical protein